MYAAPFNENPADDNYINKKKQSHNKTQKMFPKESFSNATNTNTHFNSKKVNSVLEHLHNKSTEDDDEDDEPRQFTPPPPPQSSGAERKAITENYKLLGNTPQPLTTENNLDLNSYQSNYHNDKTMEDYYKKMLPSNNRSSPPSMYSSQDVLLQKLNYMIHLLEEQQDERTNNVTEEVVLYSFLGIFIIFIVDSFTKLGKYSR